MTSDILNRSSEVNDQWKQGFTHRLAVTRPQRKPVEITWEMVKSFLRNVLKRQKPHPKYPSKPGPNVVSGTFLALVSSGLYAMYKYVKEMIDEGVVRLLKISTCMLMALGVSVYVISRIRNRDGAGNIINGGV
jgi:hypothetical protein